MRGFLALVPLLCAAVQSVSAEGFVMRQQSCDFEPGGSSVCGWSVLTPFHGATGVAAADQPPPLGPHDDVEPGGSQGHYFYYTGSAIPSIERILSFPSHQFACSLSFSYYLIGPLELDLLLAGRSLVGVFMQQNWTQSQYSNTSSWEPLSVNLSTSPREEDLGGMDFEVSEFDLGEAVDVSPGVNLFLGLDNLTVFFCLPCDFDALSQPGVLRLDAPSEIAVPLRLVSHAEHVVNASSSVCTNSTLVYGIEAVSPASLRPIFSLDPASGELTIDATGPNLVAAGVSGTLNVSVYVLGSDYQRITPPHKAFSLIPFTQPPTIVAMAPAVFNLTSVTAPFIFSFTASSLLGVALSFGDVITTPPELANNITLVVATGNEGATISGQISINETLPLITELTVAPVITFPISDSFGSQINATTSLGIPPYPPIFTRTHYEYTVTEESSAGATLGPFTVIDPNGDTIADLEISEKDLEQLFVFTRVGGVELPFCSYDIVVLQQIDYERDTSFSFEAIATDPAHPELSSTAPVVINVLPVNEFAPNFLQSSLEVTISDVQPVGVVVGHFQANDFDAGSDGDVFFQITSGNDDGFFSLSAPGFGEVVVARSPILPHTYALVVTATDEGNPPLTTQGNLTVHVVTANPVDCSQPQFAPPVITSPSSQRTEQPVGSTITLQCPHTANPAPRSYRWEHTSTSQGLVGIISEEGGGAEEGQGGHYRLSNDALTIVNATVSDEGFYLCNVTNQCGSDFVIYFVEILDYPNPPTDLRVIEGPGVTSVGVEWAGLMELHIPGAVVRPTQGYVVEVRVHDGVGGGFVAVETLPANVTFVNLDGLFPGTSYDLRVLATNLAGSTPSDAITITTNSSVPKLSYLTASSIGNDSILVEWELEYSGDGFPITQFEVHVSFQSPRAGEPPATPLLPPDTVYHVDVAYGSLVTREVLNGRGYVVTATTGNDLGAVQDITNVFVGHTDSTSCGFEENVETGCPWQLQEGVVTQASNAPALLPTSDATGNSEGQYVSAVVGSGAAAAAATVMAYRHAGYVCGYSFAYYLTHRGNASLVLQTSAGLELWSSQSDQLMETGWTSVSTSEQLYLTTVLDEGVEFVLHSFDTTAEAVVAIDETRLEFCLPCDFTVLRSASEFQLSYPASSEVHLRTARTIRLEANLTDCPNAALNFTIARVVPSELGGSVSLAPAASSRSAEVIIAPIPSDLAAPQTVGFIEVLVAVVQSDYGPSSEPVVLSALLEFVLLEGAVENCSYIRGCGFEDGGVCGWELGGGALVVSPDTSPLPALNTGTGSYVFADLPELTPDSQSLASTTVLDDYCAISFSFATSPAVEVQIMVDGAGSIWSSLLVTELAPPPSSVPVWHYEAVSIDLEAVAVTEMRALSFQAALAEGFGEAGMDPAVDGRYFALDNVTLHPCIDCSVPECTLTSCTPGHYFSLLEDTCVSCPPGYYCPNWRGLPLACPLGTFSSADSAITNTACQPCPAGSYTLQTGASSCDACPPGFSCLDPALLPAPLSDGCGGGVCPAGFSCSDEGSQTPCAEGEYSLEGQTSCLPCPEGFACRDVAVAPVPCPAGKTSPVGSVECINAASRVSLGLIVGVSVGGAVGVAVLLLVCALCCCCCCWKRRRRESGGKDSGGRHIRPSKSVSSIGTAGSLGRSSVASGSTFNSKAWRGRDTKTLMSYITNDNVDPYCDETSWMEAEAMTTSRGSSNGGTGATMAFQNEAFDEEEEEGEEEGEGDDRGHPAVEMREARYQYHPPKKTSKKSSSRF